MGTEHIFAGWDSCYVQVQPGGAHLREAEVKVNGDVEDKIKTKTCGVGEGGNWKRGKGREKEVLVSDSISLLKT